MKRFLTLFLAAALLLGCAGCGSRRQTAQPEPDPTPTPMPTAAPPRMTPTPTAAPTPTPPASPTPSPTPSPDPTACPHLRWTDGRCADCGEECAHPSWKEGRCVLCGMRCSHPTHDQKTMVCGQCGSVVPHNFLHSQCDMCGLKPVFREDVVPSSTFRSPEARGRVESRSYLTHDYYTEGQTWGYAPLWKKVTVYLPYDYDPSEKYDLLILVHGMGGTENYWLQDDQRVTHASGYAVRTAAMLDNLMYSGYCRKMIIAAPCFYRNSGDLEDYERGRDEEQFYLEVRNDLLPFLVSNYSTYAAGGSPEEISAARNHFGYAGLSMGSIYAFTSFMPKALDLFGWFGCFSGSDANMGELIAALNDPENRRYPIYYFYNCIGVKDDMYETHYAQYYDLVAEVECLTDGDNAAFTSVKKCNHDYKAWGTGLYNFLRVVFAQPEDPE